MTRPVALAPAPRARRSPAALVLTTLTLAACSAPEPPRLTPQVVQVTGVTPAALGLRLQLDAYNPNGVGLSVRSIRARVTVADRVDLGTADVPSGVSLSPKAHSPVVADVQLPWRNAAEVTALAAAQPTLPYRIDGAAQIGGERLNVELPFQLSGVLTREQLVQASLRGLPNLLGR
jgi:LEA14-like dessication related protein